MPEIETVEFATHDGQYRVGDTIQLEIAFDDEVFVTGTPVVALAVGAATRNAAYETGSGTRTLVFGYVVRPEDRDDDGVSVPANGLSGGEITDGVGNPVDRRFDALLDEGGRVVGDLEVPAVESVGLVEPTSGDTYILGDQIEVRVMFDEAVEVTDSPHVRLGIGTEKRRAAYVVGSGTDTLVFRYTVVSGDADADGIEVEAIEGGIIADTAGNRADRGLDAVETSFPFKVDTKVPGIESVRIVSKPGDDRTYIAGDEIDIDIEFSDVVYVTGQPAVVLSVGADERDAVYVDGSSRKTLLFRYVVQPGDADDDGVSIGANALRGGTIASATGIAAERSFPAAPANTAHLVDARAAEIELVEFQPHDGEYRVDETIRLELIFDEEVFVTGTPLVALAVGAATRQATYETGSGMRTLVFGYVVRPEDRDDDGVSVPANGLSGGQITDRVGNPVDRSFDALLEGGAPVGDRTRPRVASVDVVEPAAGDTYILGGRIEVRVVFDEPVEVADPPHVRLRIGTEARRAAYVAGTGTDTLVFGYTVEPGDVDTDGIEVEALRGGAIADAAGNRAVRGLDAVTTSFPFKVDADVPGVESVQIVSDAGDDDTYTPGDVVAVRVAFTDSVHVTAGEPVLTLSIGPNPRPAAYSSGSGTSVLLFEYTVIEGDYDVDGISIGANAITGGAIADANGNPADLAFGAVAAQSDHRVGTETSLVLAPQMLPIGRDLVVDLAGTLAAGGIRYDGTWAATSDNRAVADTRTEGTSLTVVPLSEGEATIEVRARWAPIVLMLSVTVVASEAETAVLESALAAVARGLLGTAVDTIGARLELAGMPAGQGVRGMNHSDAAMGAGVHAGGIVPSAWNADPGMSGLRSDGFFDSDASGLPGTTPPIARRR